MDTASESLIVYRELADHYDRLGQVSMRDRFLMLAADAALQAGQPAEAERLRQRLLTTSRHHMLRPYTSFAEAARVPDVDTYLRDLKANYPLADARDLLDTLRAGPAPAPIQPAPAPAPVQPPLAAPIPATRAIPATAPLLDVDTPAARPRIEDPPQIYPLRQEEPAQAASRPRAQPLPGRRAAPGTAANPPVATPVGRSAEPAPPAPVAPARKKPEPSGSWLSATLVVITVVTGLALAAYAFARPLLPANWLP